jgi:hypothetical protein
MERRFWPDVEETAEFWYEVEGYVAMSGYEKYYSKFEFLKDAIEYGDRSDSLFRIVKVTKTVTREVFNYQVNK